MKIGEYEVTASQYGWSYCRAHVKVKKKLFGFIPYMSTVYSTTENPFSNFPMLIVEAERMHKKEMIEWFEFVVEKYEAYKKSWSE